MADRFLLAGNLSICWGEMSHTFGMWRRDLYKRSGYCLDVVTKRDVVLEFTGQKRGG